VAMGSALTVELSGARSRELALPVTRIIDEMTSTPSDHVERVNAARSPAVIGRAGAPGGFSVVIDEVTIARARKGDRAALESLFHTFEVPVFNLARRMCRSSSDAEDVLQETFLEVVRSIRRFRGDGPLAGWIRRIAVTKALMKLRSLRARPTEEELDDASVDAGACTNAGVGAAIARVDIETALSRLPDTARVVLWLHEVEGYNHDEIGASMGKTASFSKSQLSRAYARLRGCLGVAGREE